MARIALGVLSLALLLGATGCTWTETYNQFPPHAGHDHSAHEAGHSHPHPVSE
ncbi:MAG: hypothetical protein U0790_08680 [Isosphaeraceae bacterium]